MQQKVTECHIAEPPPPAHGVLRLRRQLTVGQRSAIFLQMKPLMAAEAKARMHSGQNQHTKSPTTESVVGLKRKKDSGQVTAQAAKILGVGRSTLDQMSCIAPAPAPDAAMVAMTVPEHGRMPWP